MVLMAKDFGPLVWPLLYQTDVRCRSERMPLIRTQLLTAHNAALTAGAVSTFDTSKSWDSVFHASISSRLSMAWWNKEFERPAMMVLSRTANLATMIEGDALVEQHNQRTILGSTTTAPTVDQTHRGPPPGNPKKPAAPAPPLVTPPANRVKGKGN